ncbi:diacylglycerol kinase [Marinobacterium nitratireducens]|uniref:Diacylglycerol kinase n=1 Tax=Marinobacterium nitratireducens TaxID=518897 RepID=A0A917ZE32_9GAMM|nr:diacylglycerol kinase [Marinobacterium nitratireducens]GGO81121.1 diacylglycerol kinase [Marinobacterium nitratireducens]
MPNDKVTGPARFYYATCYSFKGMRAAFVHEPAFRYELYAVLLMLPFSFWLADSVFKLALLLVSCLLVLMAELINSAIEAVVDRAGLEFNELAGRAKDLGSAAVFVTLMIAALVWGAALWERLAAL